MKNYFFVIVLIIITVLPAKTEAQFDSIFAVINAPVMNRSQITPKHFVKLGDQNDDGFDDFLLWNCETSTLDIYFGGDPMDTIPKLKIPTWKENECYPFSPHYAALDINNDNKKDIVFNHILNVNHHLPDCRYRGYIEIFYGGSLLDTIPDITFRNPAENDSVMYSTLSVLNDFNGDGRSELVCFQGDNRDLSNQRFCFHIYNLGENFDTLAYKIIQPDIDTIHYSSKVETGDINGDGISDFCFESAADNEARWLNFYFGNKEGVFEPGYVIDQRETELPLESVAIIKDINKDGYDDLLLRDYENIYPYYFYQGISYGSEEINFNLDIGINTQNQGIYHKFTENGDYNGDGYNDLLAPTISRNIKLWLGAPNMEEVCVKTWHGNLDGIGRMVESLGDVNGDNIEDFCIGQVPSSTGINFWCGYGTYFIFLGDSSVKVDTTTTIVESINTIPMKFSICEAYPNPFNPTTNITYNLPKKGNIEIKLFNTNGEEINTLLNGYKNRGKHNLKIDGTHLSSGIYLVTFKFMENIIATKKIVLIK